MVVKLQLGFFLMSARDSYLIVDLHATFSPQNFESSIKGEIDVSLVVALALHSRVLWGCFECKVTVVVFSHSRAENFDFFLLSATICVGLLTIACFGTDAFLPVLLIAEGVRASYVVGAKMETRKVVKLHSLFCDSAAKILNNGCKCDESAARGWGWNITRVINSVPFGTALVN